MKNNYVKKVCICAVMAALFVPLEMLAANFGKIAFLDNYQIPISCFPLIIASVMFGVSWGGATALVAAFVSQLAMGYGINWSTVIWIIPTVVYALTVALLHKVLGKKDSFPLFALELFISAVVLSTLNIGASYLSNYITGGKAVANLIAIFASLKLVGGIAFAVIFAVITPPIIKRIQKTVKL